MSALQGHLPAAVAAGRRRGFGRRAVRSLLRQPVTLAAGAVLVGLLAVGQLAPVLASHGWNVIDLSDRWRNHAPTLAAGHLLGTDHVGRDVLARVIWAVHYSTETAVTGGVAAAVLGLLAGLVAGWYSGWLDAVLMRFGDLVVGFPVLVIMVVLFGVLDPVTPWEATAVFSLAMWPFAARVFRARTGSLREEEFLQAARALGASDRRILFRHLLPNAAGAIVVTLTSLVGQIVLIEATTEFFGFGITSLVRPTLGNLIGEATQTGIGPYNWLALGWWTWVSPGLALVLLLACLNLVGDGLDAALNPRTTRA